ncbi:hypothetical protein JN531_017005 (plasmid) [Flagellatimonas centrodinii]|uniref:hypothetical protein n=1 Tax=Flagellatimonas centrodinii TaxID=2806210 RepID=UPI001FED7988|nr:hypothetical protein [Flagellatimonas centrodinii]ULQ48332.1 hypothetical protein JN531_017005 [Flagellatimonas centrodinii]
MLRYFPVLAALILSSVAGAAEPCDRVQRSATWSGAPLDIAVSPEAYTEVVFPEPLAGILPEREDGLRYFENPFPDRLFFTVDDPEYHAIAIVQGKTGQSYHLRLDARSGCPDSTVKVLARGTSAVSAVPDELQRSTRRKLIEYMILGETPQGYARKQITGDLSDREIIRQGSVGIYLTETYRGVNYTGYVLLAVNEGRTPYRVALESIDFAARGLTDAVGLVREITMQPYDFRLGPAPEYAADATDPSHQGLIYLVTDNHRRDR